MVPTIGSSAFGNRRVGQPQTASRSSIPYVHQSVYEMAALTTDLDTQAITTKIKETLLAHNIGQKVREEAALNTRSKPSIKSNDALFTHQQ